MSVVFKVIAFMSVRPYISIFYGLDCVERSPGGERGVKNAPAKPAE